MELRLKDLPSDEFELMHQSVLRLLDELGVSVANDRVRGLLEHDRRNRIGDDGRVHLAGDYVQDVLSRVPPEGFRLYGRDPSQMLEVRCGQLAFRPSTGEPFVWDYDLRERRPATAKDAEVLVRVTEKLEGFAMVNAVVNPFDTPAARANVELFVLSHRYSTKPSDVTVSSAREVRAIAAIASAIRNGEDRLRERPLTAVDVSVVTPLHFTSDDAEAFVAAAEHGIPVEILTSPTLAVSAPVTPAGAVVVSAAEMIAAICILYSIEPGLGVVNTARISPIDMRTGAYNYGAPELAIGSVLSTAYCDRLGIPTNSYGFGTSAKFPGMQASMEKTLGGVLLAMAAPHLVTGSGTLDNSLVTCPELLVIDHELSRELRRVRDGVPVTEDTLAVDGFIEAIRESGSMIADEHTVRHLRSGAVFDCGLNQWGSYDSWLSAGMPELLDIAHQRVEQLLAMEPVETFDPDVQGRIDEVIAGFDDAGGL